MLHSFIHSLYKYIFLIECLLFCPTGLFPVPFASPTGWFCYHLFVVLNILSSWLSPSSTYSPMSSSDSTPSINPLKLPQSKRPLSSLSPKGPKDTFHWPVVHDADFYHCILLKSFASFSHVCLLFPTWVSSDECNTRGSVIHVIWTFQLG